MSKKHTAQRHQPASAGGAGRGDDETDRGDLGSLDGPDRSRDLGLRNGSALLIPAAVSIPESRRPLGIECSQRRSQLIL